MAIERAEKRTITVRSVTRTIRFDGYTPLNATPYVDIYRETILIDDATGETVGLPVVSVFRRSFGDMAHRSWPLSDGSNVSAMQVYETLSLAFDEFAVEPVAST